MRFFPLALVAAAALSLTACDSADPVDPDPIDLEVETASNVYAPQSGGMGAPIGGGYVFYSIENDRVVLEHNGTPRTDSASANWDIAFRGTTVLINGGTSGPGEGGAVVLTGTTFEDVTEAPDTTYTQDAAGAPAIRTGSGNGWYNYNNATQVVTPIPGRVIVIRTASGNYAKIRFLSYYRDNPATIDPAVGLRYYTFEYVYQPDGSRNFETTIPTND